jgi:hypothetical protein
MVRRKKGIKGKCGVTIPIACPQRTDFAIPLLEGGHTEAASITKASSARLLKRKRQNQAEEAFVASPSLVQHSHLVPA